MCRGYLFISLEIAVKNSLLKPLYLEKKNACRKKMHILFCSGVTNDCYRSFSMGLIHGLFEFLYSFLRRGVGY